MEAGKHWSTRTLAQAQKVSKNTIHRIWQEHQLGASKPASAIVLKHALQVPESLATTCYGRYRCCVTQKPNKNGVFGEG